MDQDPGTAELSPATKQLSRSTSAVRMLRHRERRRKGLRFLGIELREREIEALIRRGRLLTPLEKSKPIVADVSRSTVLGAIPGKPVTLTAVGSEESAALGPEPMTLARVKVTSWPPPTVPTSCMKRPVGRFQRRHSSDAAPQAERT